MNASHDIERDLARWMEVVAPTRAPDNLAASILERTSTSKSRPGWLVRLLEPPMQTQLSLRNYLGFRRSPRLILVALLILVLAVGGVIVGSQLIRHQPLPPPFGLAHNGLLGSNVDGGIVVMESDGSHSRRLELPFDALSGGWFSRDGIRIAAWATSGEGKKSLIVANADGTGAFAVDPARDIADPGGIDWSPDGRRLAFSASDERLFVADIDARKITELELGASTTFRKDPAWGPDGRLAYKCVTADGVPHLCVASADLQVEQMVQTSAGNEYAFKQPSWSRDGKSIAYQVDDVIDHGRADYGWDVATIDLTTGQEKILTRGFADHTILPAWTPDDRYLVFGTASGPGVVRSDGTDLRVLGHALCTGMEPSPDGAFVTCLTEDDQVLLYPITGGQPAIIKLDGAATSVNWQRVAN